MAYLVMARKWRPRNFEEMVGQEHIARTLRNAIEGKRIAHAYLFTGTRGVGKTTSARILAKALNCAQGPTPVPCEVCESCRSIGAGTSMDVLEIDGASNRGVGEIRELREQVKYAPMQGAYKVYIIDEVHMLTKEAFNALLKTLEEPPPHVVFLFATTEANKVPHTILSRVQRFDFKRISEPMIRGRLEFICGKEGIAFETEALEAIARKADGSMRDALSLFDQVIAFSGTSLTLDHARRILGLPPDELFASLLDALVGHDAAACYALVEKVVGEGLELGEFLLGFGGHLRDLLFARQEGISAAALGFSENRYLDLRAKHAELRDGDIIRYGKIVSDLLGGLRGAAHPRLHVEMGLLRMASLDRIATLSQMMQLTQGGLGPDSPAKAMPTTHSAIASPAPPAPPSSSPPAEASETIAAKKKSPLESLAFAEVVEFRGNPLDRSDDPGLQEDPEGHDALESSDFEALDSEASGDSEPMPSRPKAAAVLEKAPLRFASPQDLASQWPLLLDAIAHEPSLLSMHLGGSRASLRPEDQALVIEVAHQVALEFFQGSGEGRRKLQNLIQERIQVETRLSIKVALREGPASETAYPNALPKDMRGHLADEPIVKTLLDLFDGRIVASGILA